jgi:ABC-2 type transport system permease protein
VRDPSSILIAFVLPLILLFLFGYGVSLDARQVRLGVVMEDSSPEARRLAASFQATPFFRRPHGVGPAHLEPDLVSSRLRGIVVIPQDFTRSLYAPGTTAQSAADHRRQ